MRSLLLVKVLETIDKWGQDYLMYVAQRGCQVQPYITVTLLMETNSASIRRCGGNANDGMIPCSCMLLWCAQDG